MNWILTGIPFLLLYLGLTANFQPGNIIVGVFVAFLAALVSRSRWQVQNFRAIPQRIFYLLLYALILSSEIIKSGLVVARLVLSVRPDLHPGIVAIPSKCESELARALNAHSLTVTPGELVVEIGADGTMYTHCLDARQGPEYIVAAQKRRRRLLEKIFK